MNNRWLQLEYFGKGICLALLGLLALVQPDWTRTAIFFAVVLLTLIMVLAWTGWQTARQGHRVRGRVPAFLLFLVLENPVRVYGGLLAGLALATAIQVGWFEAWTWTQVLMALGAGLALGVVFLLLRQVHNRWTRTGTVLVVAAAVAFGVIYYLENYTTHLQDGKQYLFAAHILLAIPLLYLLTFAGQAEETELEIGTICVALGVALWMMLPGQARLVAVLLPLVLYVAYTQRILKNLRIFKHVLRGMSYNNLGLHRQALLAYRRALQLDSENALAREGLWRVHKDMDFSKVVHDPETMALVNLDLCLDRAKELLLRGAPTPERLDEAHKLMDLVLDQRPIMQPAVYYWRAVAHTHAKEYDKAEVELRAVLDSSNYPPDDAYRESVLMACWQLVLLQHGELKRRLGTPLLAEEGKRMEAIAAVERHLAQVPDDGGAWELKRLLYEGVTENDYQQRAGAALQVPPNEFDHAYCEQLGLALISDVALWQRGADYLRLAARGFPSRGPSLYYQIAQACQRAGDQEGYRYNGEMVKLLARENGVKNLAQADKEAYFTTVKQLGEEAYARGDLDRAIENLTLFIESDQSGQDTIRLLTELYERKNDALSALLFNEKALVFDRKNKLYVDRKERYYYSVTPAELQARIEQARKSFDVDYCLRKAKSLLDLRSAGTEQVEWAQHLLDLARVVEPENIIALTLAARARLWRGEENEALPLLEEARAAKKDGFASADEADAWYTACRLLGDLYLKTLGRPDQAVACFSDYRKYSKSGADTLYKMGQAYEQLGDRVKAAKCYQNVTIYDHPLASDAYQALQRLEAGGN